jgi:hypothetical protein
VNQFLSSQKKKKKKKKKKNKIKKKKTSKQSEIHFRSISHGEKEKTEKNLRQTPPHHCPLHKEQTLTSISVYGYKTRRKTISDSTMAPAIDAGF